MLEFGRVSFSFGKRPVLRELSFRTAPGECLVVAGANGSGKTTLLSLAAGILSPDAGTVRRNGPDADRIGYVPQGSALLEDATVGENLRFFADLAHAPVPDSLPFAVERYRDRRVSRLSGGMKKQVSIACAMIGEPGLLLLDEPCASLDLLFRDALIREVVRWKAAGHTVLYVGHDPGEFYPFFDRILFFSETPFEKRRGELIPPGGDEESFRRAFVQLLEHNEQGGNP